MKKKILTILLFAFMTVSFVACGKNKDDDAKNQNAEHVSSEEAESVTDESEFPTATLDEFETQEATEQSNDSTEPNEEQSAFSFKELVPLHFTFSSGAGAWETSMTVKEDGSFFGEYYDADMGATGEGYPYGTLYLCVFNGKFSEPQKINEYTYCVQIVEMDYEHKPGTEEIIDGVLYCYETPYGLTETKNIFIYLPGAPLSELSEEYRSWVGYYDLTTVEETELPFYSLCNEEQQYGFVSYSVIDSAKETLAYVEQQAADLENPIENHILTQFELNEKSQELYEQWDWALNVIWNALIITLDEEEMETLRLMQREWIATKEEAVKQAGAEVEGGSMQPMVMNLKAAELTKIRVYELMDILETGKLVIAKDEVIYPPEVYGTIETTGKEYASGDSQEPYFYYDLEKFFVNETFENATAINATLAEIYDEYEALYLQDAQNHSALTEDMQTPYDSLYFLRLAYVGDDYISIMYNNISYYGGAHPYSQFDGITIDCKTGKVVTASELLGKSDGEILEQVSKEMGFDVIGTWDDVDFYITDSTIVFFYRMPNYWEDVVWEREKSNADN